MNILVLGSSSSIGKSIVKHFSKDNNLYLICRDSDKLETLKKQSIELGCNKIKIIELDLGTSINLEKLLDIDFDLIFNVACSTSRLMNNQIFPNKYNYHTLVDFSNPLAILEYILLSRKKENNSKKLNYIFINTILSKVQSSGYSIYYSYKTLQQEYIYAFQREYKDILKPINVIIGTNINKFVETKKSIILVKKIDLAIKNNKSQFIFGLRGKVLYTLYRINPLISDFLITIKRFITIKK
jgi:short-subunit dehydrogenase